MTTIGYDRPLTVPEIRWAVEQACRAPSVHNTQPWRFRFADRTFELWADTSRGLTASDPDGRELVISCGAALYNLRVALRKLGYSAVVHALPDRRQPRLLARVAVSESVPADAAARRAYAALSRRHTHRGGFDERPLPPALAVRLQEAAEAEGGQLIFVHHPGQRRRVLQIARAAERALSADGGVVSELAEWTPAPGSGRRDGVPAAAYARAPAGDPDDIQSRNFDLGRDYGALDPVVSPPGTVAVLATEGDLEPDWLAGGQALEHVLVTAAEHWVFAAMHSQVAEVDDLRAELRRELCASSHPHLLLRFGFAGNAPLTPRRPVADVLETE
jgi:hypothetical protein